MYQILSQSVRFCRLYIRKKQLGVFLVNSVFGSQVQVQVQVQVGYKY